MKKITTQNQKRFSFPLLQVQAALLAGGLTLCGQPLQAQTLEGRNKGDTNDWFTGNLAGWAELEYIPMRVSFATGSAGSHSVTLNFPHFTGKVFGFENLSDFRASTPNLQFTSPATLVTDASGNWSYVFAVDISDNNPAEVRFFARLASGAHLYGGSSLQLKGSAGIMQFHKPLPTVGAPDLALNISGSALVLPGGKISYALSYTNQAGFDGATGVQITQVLAPEVIVDAASLPANASLIGNTLFWDLGNLPPHTGGQIAFSGIVQPDTVAGTALVDDAQIFSAENDLNISDNSAVLTSSVICGDTVPAIVSNPISAYVCPGDAVVFSVDASGPAGMTYQWSKDGSPIAGATASSYQVASALSKDTGSYSVTVSSPCATLISEAASLGFRADQPILITSCARQADGSFLLSFPTGCGATYAVQYTQDFVTWTTSPVTVAGHGVAAQWVDPVQTALPNVANLQTARFYRVIRVQ
jgi:Domain of unknown function DUF11